MKKPEKKKIMLVDDSSVMLRNIKNILDRKYEVFLTTSGRQALKAIPEKEPDVVVLDYKMPDLDGRAVFEEMQKDEYMKTVPVIFLTSVSDSKTIQSILALRPAGYILKPPDKDKVLEVIQEALKKK
ncbi:response regulator [bacterium D16-51]|nr:response regulator [bacterium D16-59]RKI61526.1 response regulator [bacterium D16-51]